MVKQALEFPNISKKRLQDEVIPELLQWSLSNGLTMYPPTFKLEETMTVPMTLFPTYLPKDSFNEAIKVQKIYNEIYAKIAQNKDQWLSTQSDILAAHDPEFIGKLWKIYHDALNIGVSQKNSLGIFRSDYLIDRENDQIKQVEFNTISVSFGGLSTKVCELHRFLNDTGRYKPDLTSFYSQEIPISSSSELLAKALSRGVEKYGPTASPTIVAFIVQSGERNVFDQKILEYNLFKNYGIKSVRLTLHEIHEKTHMDPDSKRLYLASTQQEISLVYFRAGYSPNDFTTQQDWSNRLTLEVSYAIKAPNLLTQLSGTKKIQQLLTDPETLHKFIPDKSWMNTILSTFVKIYPLDDSPLGQYAKKLAMECPERYVLKPQREGGGNNIYKHDIPLFLQQLAQQEWGGYVLMELINPQPTTSNIVIHGDKQFKEPILSELGIFGYILFDNNEIFENEYAGWMLRSKFASSDEGGVAAGFGCMDSIVLY